MKNAINCVNKNRSVKKPASGHQNFKKNKDGTFDLLIGSVRYGRYAEITKELLAFRDQARAKQGLPPADY